jgi:hypothetical protein
MFNVEEIQQELSATRIEFSQALTRAPLQEERRKPSVVDDGPFGSLVRTPPPLQLNSLI